jgi:hypothetical protein
MTCVISNSNGLFIGGFIAIPIDPKQSVSFEELLMSQVTQQEALTRLLVDKGIFTKEEALEMVKVVDREMKRKRIF